MVAFFTTQVGSKTADDQEYALVYSERFDIDEKRQWLCKWITTQYLFTEITQGMIMAGGNVR